MSRCRLPPHAVVCIALTILRLTSGKMVPRWSEEFRPGCKGNTTTCINGGIDLTRFGFELGDGTSYGPNLIGWGNWQRQCHTNHSSNVRVEAFPDKPTDGMLVIQAGYSPGQACYNENAPPSVTDFTSARVITRNKAAFRWKGTPGKSTPVRIDVRVQVPLVNGTWPAAWMLPDTNKEWCLACGPYGDGWCLGGEIDIMEHINTNDYTISNLQYGGLANASWLECKEKIGKFRAKHRASDWNVISLIWDSTYMQFLANGKQYHKVTLGTWNTGAAPNNTYAPFDVPFYLIFDMAIGGLYPGYNIDSAAIAAGAARYNIDYIRVWDLVP
ncbi:hypothetical protein GPECTOR_5g54 [Gonium pectorale]|uniref:GH16 domain-containing protein n=1 Tax=Gonium pectorale TaxID=33097 RepID=A0A150GXI5_GONPE|nr:hypothetical protein GPECTOR_5g54 [Gonium pectorale]|eukprot:KXZ54398.1 hypothetical protein GPECTOR_5g54 [Gonium pectorale]